MSLSKLLKFRSVPPTPSKSPLRTKNQDQDHALEDEMEKPLSLYPRTRWWPGILSNSSPHDSLTSAPAPTPRFSAKLTKSESTKALARKPVPQSSTTQRLLEDIANGHLMRAPGHLPVTALYSLLRVLDAQSAHAMLPHPRTWRDRAQRFLDLERGFAAGPSDQILWIAWTFGDWVGMNRVVAYLAMSCAIDGRGDLLDLDAHMAPTSRIDQRFKNGSYRSSAFFDDDYESDWTMRSEGIPSQAKVRRLFGCEFRRESGAFLRIVDYIKKYRHHYLDILHVRYTSVMTALASSSRDVSALRRLIPQDVWPATSAADIMCSPQELKAVVEDLEDILLPPQPPPRHHDRERGRERGRGTKKRDAENNTDAGQRPSTGVTAPSRTPSGQISQNVGHDRVQYSTSESERGTPLQRQQSKRITSVTDQNHHGRYRYDRSRSSQPVTSRSVYAREENEELRHEQPQEEKDVTTAPLRIERRSEGAEQLLLRHARTLLDFELRRVCPHVVRSEFYADLRGHADRFGIEVNAPWLGDIDV